MPVSSLNSGQQEAVETRNCSILVSAPAGSGKTKILVNRIMSLIEDDGYNVDSLLVLTFTNAAALEMKQRLEATLQQRLQEDISTELKDHLLKQKQLLPKAYITNFHGFCSTLLKQYGYLINLNSNFEICSDPTLIKHQVLDQCLAKWCQDDQFNDFVGTYFADYYFQKFKGAIFKFENLSNTIYNFDQYLEEIKTNIYQHILTDQSYQTWPITPQVIKLLKQQAIMGLNKVYELANYAATHQLSFYYQNPFDDNPKKANLPSPYDAHLKYYFDLLKALDNNDIEQIIFASKAKLIKSYDSRGLFNENNEEYKAEYNRRKNNIVKFYQSKFNDLVYDDLEEFKQVLQTSLEPIEQLVTYLNEFKAAYKQYKQANNILDFNDLEAYALELLEPQYQIVDLLYHQLKEIMIDEYQDTNQIQETLINKIANYQEPKINRFMVGDMKQSIYRFREADPEIFNQKYLTFNQLPGTKRIDLRYNYRSNKIVLDSVNYIFNQIMDKDIGGLDYYLDDSAKLNYDYLRKEGAKEIEEKEMVTKKANQRIESQNQFTSEILLSYQTGSNNTDAEIEAKMVAKRIQDIVGKLELENYDHSLRLTNYRDIVVLMRNTRSFIAFKKIFNRYAIPSHIVLSQGFLQEIEIIDLIHVLKAFNNHLDDIAMTSLMMGNYLISNFDENLMASIRQDDSISIYDNIINYIAAKGTDFQRLQAFLDYYQQMREYFNTHTVKEGLLKFLDDSQYLPFLASLINGGQRVANVELFIQKLEEQKDESLNKITTSFTNLLDNGIGMSPATVSSHDDNVVSFMTIHKSKGLEFPIVFVSNLHNKFNQQDAREQIISDKQLGIAMKPRIKTDLEPYHDAIIEYDNKYRKIIGNYQTNEAINEEMRIFYVALTRASQKLILTGLIKDVNDLVRWQDYVINNGTDFIKNPRDQDKVILYHNARRQNSYLDWLMIAIMSHDDIIAQGINKTLLDDNYDDETVDLIKHNFQTIMIHQNKQLIQDNTKHSRFSINIFSHDDINQQIIITNDDETKVDLALYDHYQNYHYPFDNPGDKTIAVTKKIADGDREFIPASYDLNDENIEASSRGTIIHSFLEQLNISNDLDLSKEIQRIKSYQLFDNQAWQVIERYLPHIEKFITSDVFTLMANSLHLYKEKEFSMLEDGQIIHGIFDAVCINEDKITVIDYKTDRLKANVDEATLISLHQMQLEYYKKILARVFPQTKIEALVYYLYIDRYVIF